VHHCANRNGGVVPLRRHHHGWAPFVALEIEAARAGDTRKLGGLEDHQAIANINQYQMPSKLAGASGPSVRKATQRGFLICSVGIRTLEPFAFCAPRANPRSPICETFRPRSGRNAA
jgi:hypothetical protein